MSTKNGHLAELLLLVPGKENAIAKQKIKLKCVHMKTKRDQQSHKAGAIKWLSNSFHTNYKINDCIQNDSDKNKVVQFLHRAHHYKNIQGIMKSMLILMLAKMT